MSGIVENLITTSFKLPLKNNKDGKWVSEFVEDLMTEPEPYVFTGIT